jgi:hypothetical protein
MPPPADMLAWVHSSLASEQELLVSLFGEDGQQQQQQPAPVAHSDRGGAGDNDGVPSIAQLLDSVFESVCRPLKASVALNALIVQQLDPPCCLQTSSTFFSEHGHKRARDVRLPALPSPPETCRAPSFPAPPSLQVRIEQVLMSSPPPLLCFRLAQLLAFYLATVEGLLGAGSQLAGGRGTAAPALAAGCGGSCRAVNKGCGGVGAEGRCFHPCTCSMLEPHPYFTATAHPHKHSLHSLWNTCTASQISVSTQTHTMPLRPRPCLALFSCVPPPPPHTVRDTCTYKHTHAPQHPPAAAEALRSSRAMAQRTFHETLRQRGDKLLRYPPPPPRDLTPPQQVRPMCVCSRPAPRHGRWKTLLPTALVGPCGEFAPARSFLLLQTTILLLVCVRHRSCWRALSWRQTLWPPSSSRLTPPPPKRGERAAAATTLQVGWLGGLAPAAGFSASILACVLRFYLFTALTADKGEVECSDVLMNKLQACVSPASCTCTPLPPPTHTPTHTHTPFLQRCWLRWWTL